LDHKKLLNARTLFGMRYNFCFMNFSVKYTVWSGEVFWPQEVRSRLDSNIHKNFPGSCSSTVPNFINTGPMVWISFANIHTRTH
jgi:hypothetical protein